jgi:HNH endonuclease
VRGIITSGNGEISVKANIGPTIKIEDPPGFIVRTEAQKAAFDNGFRLDRGAKSGWMRYGSTTARGEIWIAGASPTGPWFLSLEHNVVVVEIGLNSQADCFTGPGVATYIFRGLHDLHSALDHVYRLAVSLPDAPLQQFHADTACMPRTTEAERLVVQRVGQTIFREALLKYWNDRCPITGVTDIQLLRASHIVPWAECETDALRLDVHNGLLLSALWDAAFDSGIVSFTDEGAVLSKRGLSSEGAAVLGIHTPRRLSGLTDSHRVHLARHRAKHGY